MPKDQKNKRSKSVNHYSIKGSHIVSFQYGHNKPPKNQIKFASKTSKKFHSVRNQDKSESKKCSRLTVHRKDKQKKAEKLIEHETPVLGKYFTENSRTNHFTTLGNHEQEEQSNVKQQSPANEIESYIIDTSLRQKQNPTNIYHSANAKPLPYLQEVEKQLDETIGKLKKKQEVIGILNKTIQTKIVTGMQQSKQAKYRNRIDAYEVQINFYVDKISQLQKEVYQKNKALMKCEDKSLEFITLVKNSKRLINQNIRLKQEKELMDRENAVLKKIVGKSYERKRIL